MSTTPLTLDRNEVKELLALVHPNYHPLARVFTTLCSMHLELANEEAAAPLIAQAVKLTTPPIT